MAVPILDGVDGLVGGAVVELFHLPVHGGQLHLAFEVHLHRAVLHRRVPEILIRVAQLDIEKTLYRFFLYAWIRFRH